MENELHQGIIVVGQRVECGLYGGKIGTIYAIHGEQSPQTCGSVLNGICATGGSAEFDIAWDADEGISHMIPEALIRSGVQWRLLPEVASAAETQEAFLRASAVIENKQIEQDEAAARFRVEAERLRTTHSNLVQPSREVSNAKAAATNIRTELKAAFPGEKFSVRTSQSSIRVSWEDGPVASRVTAIIKKYEMGYFNGGDDAFHYTQSAWTEVFGGVKYTFDERQTSEAIRERAYALILQRLNGNMQDFPASWAQCKTAGMDGRSIPDMKVDPLSQVVSIVASAWDASENRWHPEDLDRSWWIHVFKSAMEELNREADSETAALAPGAC